MVAEGRFPFDDAESHRPTYTSGRRWSNAPRSLSLLVIILVAILVVGAYVVYWLDGLRQKNDRVRLQRLEERATMSGWQRQYHDLRFPDEPEVEVPGHVYLPLNRQEQAELDGLLKQYGRQFKPNVVQRSLIAETEGLMAATRSASSSPAATNAESPSTVCTSAPEPAVAHSMTTPPSLTRPAIPSPDHP